MIEKSQKKVYEMSLEEVEREEKPNQPKILKNCCFRQGCENIDNYARLNRIHEGTYGVVYRAK